MKIDSTFSPRTSTGVVRFKQAIAGSVLAVSLLGCMSQSLRKDYECAEKLGVSYSDAHWDVNTNQCTVSAHAGTTLAGSGSAPHVCSKEDAAPAEVRSKPGYARVTVTVTDPSGNYVKGLGEKDFKVYADGQLRPVEFFRTDPHNPASLGILVDTSGSMVPKIPQARAAIEQFLKGLDQHDDVFLFAFSDRAFLLQPLTTDHSLVASRLGLLHAFGRTALYDVILAGLKEVAHGCYDKKALLVVTDGMDTASTSPLREVVMEARRQDVLIYSIGIGDPNRPSTPGKTRLLGPFTLGLGSDTERVDADTLRTLSTETGAKTFITGEIGDDENLRKALEEIVSESRSQYTLGFVRPNPQQDYQDLRVELPNRQDVTVRVRKGVGTETSGSPSGTEKTIQKAAP